MFSGVLTITHKSPHLFGVLGRTVDSHGVQLVSQAFEVSILHGGESELDIERREGVSFNPHPGRVGLILINDFQERSPEVIACGVLRTAKRPLEVSVQKLFGEKVSHLLALSKLPAQELLANIEQSDYRSAAKVALALFLDRTRHLHQVEGYGKEGVRGEIFSQADCYIQVAERVSPAVSLLLQRWKQRAERGI